MIIPAVRRFALAGLLFGCFEGHAFAYPLLQLTIAGGTYDTATETTFATSAAFTLYAYLTPPPNTTPTQLAALLSRNYYIAAAVAPRVSIAGANLGTFSFNNQTVRATQDMVWGTPPLETFLGGTAGGDSGDLARHGIYDTYFKEFSFNFTPTQRTTAVDVQEVVGQTPTPTPNGDMYYMAFTVDTELLSPVHQIHFDMYDEVIKGTDIDVGNFAPFSHDAQSMVMPEPGSLLLLGTGIAAVIARQRRRRSPPPAA